MEAQPRYEVIACVVSDLEEYSEGSNVANVGVAAIENLHAGHKRHGSNSSNQTLRVATISSSLVERQFSQRREHLRLEAAIDI